MEEGGAEEISQLGERKCSSSSYFSLSSLVLPLCPAVSPPSPIQIVYLLHMAKGSEPVSYVLIYGTYVVFLYVNKKGGESWKGGPDDGGVTQVHGMLLCMEVSWPIEIAVYALERDREGFVTCTPGDFVANLLLAVPLALNFIASGEFCTRSVWGGSGDPMGNQSPPGPR